jgi:UDP-N-acetylmuramate dehydrogenase
MITIQEQVLLAPYTTFKIGGPARYFVVAKTVADVAEAITFAKQKQVKWFVLGGGSDVLVSDAGFNGLVIKSELTDIAFDSEKGRVTAGSGVRLSRMITQAAQQGLSGLEFAIGVPASVGGAVWANLGARGKETQEVFVEATVLDADGNQHLITREQGKFGYRESIFKHEQYIILEATFQLQHEDPETIKKRVQELSALRKETQDLAAKCAGCVFRNPKNQTDVAAAKLIDDLGLKGLTIGGAQVSPIHANFIINTGNATAEDVIILISLIKQKVRDNKGVQLMEEIEYVGFDQ